MNEEVIKSAIKIKNDISSLMKEIENIEDEEIKNRLKKAYWSLIYVSIELKDIHYSNNIREN